MAASRPPRRTPDERPGPKSWWDQAACRSTDTELFYPAGVTGAALEQTAKAKAVCAGCDVLSECLEYALQTRQDAGIWGGMDEDERRRLRRSRRRQ